MTVLPKMLQLQLLLLTAIPQVLTATEEYCHWQPYSLRCPTSQVILMETALYGRMHLGECIKKADQIGCSVDVLRVMDGLCSGRQNCTGMFDRKFYQSLDCGEMIAYLEVSYVCLGGNLSLFTPTLNDLARCGADQPIPVTSAKQGYILGGTDTKGCPIRIHALPGQTIQIYLYDFGKSGQTGDSSYKGNGQLAYRSSQPQSYKRGHMTPIVAERYATLVDRAASRHSTRISSTEKRYSLVYTSKGSIVDVDLTPDTQHKFILKYQAIGCPDPVLPADTYMLRRGHKASVYCNYSSNIWHIVCKGTAWVGPITNCTIDTKHAQTTSTEKEVGRNWESFGLVIAVFIGVLIGGICGFAMLVMVMILRKRKRRMNGECSTNTGINSKECPNYGLFGSSHCSAQTLASGSNYTHIWRLQRPNHPTDQYQTQSERMLTNSGPVQEIDEVEPDYESRSVPAVTYICRHNKNYEKPVPQIISDSQLLNPQPINRNRLWSPQGKKQVQTGELIPEVNDSGIET